MTQKMRQEREELTSYAVIRQNKIMGICIGINLNCQCVCKIGINYITDTFFSLKNPHIVPTRGFLGGVVDVYFNKKQVTIADFKK